MNETIEFSTANVSSEPLGHEDRPIISDRFRETFEPLIIFTMLPLNILGVITNMINSRVFVEQGVRNDSTTIGLLSLAICDLFGCLSMIPYSLCYLVRYLDRMSTQYTCLAYATILCYPHIIFSHTNTWVTVYISMERSLCVIIPLKVKLLFKPKLTLFVVVSIFLFFVGDQLLYSVHTKIIWQFVPSLNETIALNYDTPVGREVLYINSIFSNTVLCSLAIIIVAITTSIMVNKLIEVKKWRQTNTSKVTDKKATDGKSKKPMSSKDIEVIKSVTTVTGIFLVCLSMSHIPATSVVALPGVSFAGVNRNLYFLVYMVRFLFDAVNSSINFFFYIRISSRYKNAFSAVFPRCALGQTTQTTD